jgi:hypothetical protein
MFAGQSGHTIAAMAQPSDHRCRRHSQPATYVNRLSGELLCDYDELLYRRSPRHGELAPLSAAATVEPAVSETVVLSLDVNNARFFLCDNDFDGYDGDLGAGSALLHCMGGACALITGRESGSVSVAVTLAAQDPGADLGYADIVEASVEFRSPEAHISHGHGDRQKLPRLPAGAGPYRLRYHARNLVGAQRQNQPCDEYLLQIWPGPAPTPPATLRSTVA